MQSHHSYRDAQPHRQRSYKHSTAARREIEKQTADMPVNDIIEHSESAWALPVVLVKKKTGETRMCIDYRRINSVTKHIYFPFSFARSLCHTHRSPTKHLHIMRLEIWIPPNSPGSRH